MKITKVNIPKEINPNGIDDIKMAKLGNIVIIAGKNGSGKSRILNNIFRLFPIKPKKGKVENVISLVASYQKDISEVKNRINKSTKFDINYQTVLAESADINIAGDIALIQHYENQIHQIHKDIDWPYIETDLLSDSYHYVPFVPKNLTINDNNSLPRNDILNAASGLDRPGVDGLPAGTFAKIQIIQERWFNATHQHTKIIEAEKTQATIDYEKLQEIIYIFLGVKVERNLNGDATIFGFPLGQSKLSDGQKILLQFCLAIYSQQQELKDLILVLDEPENHLHPAAIIEIIKRIQTCVTDGQIWIATHSIPLLAHFDPSVIWYVEDGKISHAGKTPEKVLQSLLGDEEEIAKLQDFISLPAQYASARYAYESLFAPQAVMTGKEDPQIRQIRDELWANAANGKIRVLDYGAGKGRLIANLAEEDEGEHTSLVNSIDYIAFDKYSSDKEACEAALTKVYGSAERRYYNDFDTLFSYYDVASFDVVIMCNVLHEIDPADWLTLFQNGGAISGCIKETGSLLIIEDHRMPIGEKAYQKGFLVLDTPEIKELFQIKEADTDFSFSDYRSDGRLKAHKIPKRLLGNITYETRKAAIELLSNKARNKILETRKGDQNYKNGILHGFWTQQFANAQLNLAELGG